MNRVTANLTCPRGGVKCVTLSEAWTEGAHDHGMVKSMGMRPSVAQTGRATRSLGSENGDPPWGANIAMGLASVHHTTAEGTPSCRSGMLKINGAVQYPDGVGSWPGHHRRFAKWAIVNFPMDSFTMPTFIITVLTIRSSEYMRSDGIRLELD